jgi:hypothetical protein
VIELRNGNRKNDKHLFIHTDLHKTNHKLVSTLLEHFWWWDSPWVNSNSKNSPRADSDSQDSPRPRLGGSHHLPPYSILCASSRGPHPNGILSWDSQMGVPKLPKLGFSRLWGPITLCVDLRLRWGLKQSCSPCRDIFNVMSHATWTQGNRVNSWLLVVVSQNANLTLDPSFGHNLCFRCPNGSCEPILNIFVLISFQWYKKIFNITHLYPWNHFLKIGCPLKLQLPKWEFTWEWECSFSHTLNLPGTWNVSFELHSWFTPLQALALVVSPRLGLQHWKT